MPSCRGIARIFPVEATGGGGGGGREYLFLRGQALSTGNRLLYYVP